MAAVLILTPDPADPDFAELWHERAAELTMALARVGLDAGFAPWTAPAEQRTDTLVLPLLAWGYHRDPERWHGALDCWEAAGVPLANPAAVLRWNSDKRYLIDFAERGAPVVPTLFFADLRPADIERAEAQFGATVLIAKPPVSAGAQGIVRLDRKHRLRLGFMEQTLVDWQPFIGCAMLLQPLMPAIHSEGELSLFYFAGRYSHTIVKRPRRGDFRVQHQHGGIVSACDPPAAARAAAEGVLAIIPETLAYARIDLVADSAGAYRLMELELIEPELFLDHAPDCGRRFAEAVAATIA